LPFERARFFPDWFGAGEREGGKDEGGRMKDERGTLPPVLRERDFNFSRHLIQRKRALFRLLPRWGKLSIAVHRATSLNRLDCGQVWATCGGGFAFLYFAFSFLFSIFFATSGTFFTFSLDVFSTTGHPFRIEPA
jgi:hypothetical protein